MKGNAETMPEGKKINTSKNESFNLLSSREKKIMKYWQRQKLGEREQRGGKKQLYYLCKKKNH